MKLIQRTISTMLRIVDQQTCKRLYLLLQGCATKKTHLFAPTLTKVTTFLLNYAKATV